jgi:quercetin dioxygenase-like cupin family protein
LSIEVFDYRTEGPRLRNFFVTPECRARFMTIEPGADAPFHFHELGQEVFVVMEGRARFVIGDDEAVLGPGEACAARAGVRHWVGPVGEEAVTLFLCVTPHIQPTHAFFDEEGAQLPDDYRPSFMPASEPSEMLRPESDAELAEMQIAALQELAKRAGEAARAAEMDVAAMGASLEAGDAEAAAATRDAMWRALASVFESAMSAADTWNVLTARTVGAPRGEG